MAQKQEIYMSPQIARYANGSSILEFNSKLNVADVKNAYKIHAGTDEVYSSNGSGRAVKKTSKIGVKLLRYGKDNKVQTTVEANIEVSDIKRLWCYLQTADKVYGKVVSQTKVHSFKTDEKGLSDLQMLTIAREEKDSKGDPYKLEWKVDITNGKAKPLSDGVGYESSTYQKTNQIFVRISKQDFFALISQLNSFIVAWENWAANILFTKRFKMEIELQSQREESKSA